jgi:hypothetical protein
MIPRFDDKLSIVGANKTSVRAEGPYPLAGNEKDAYFWLRVSQERSNGEIDAVGTLSLERDDLEEEFNAAATRVEKKVAAAIETHGLTAPLSAEKVSAAVTEAEAEAGPKWHKTIRGKTPFRKGRATAEAWLLIRTTHDPPVVTQTYWKTEVTLTDG